MKKFPALLASFLALLFLASCSTMGDVPNDDVYYTKKTKNSTEYDWDNFQKNAQSYSSGNVKAEEAVVATPAIAETSNSDSPYQNNSNASGDIATTVKSGADTDGDNQYIDEYYDSQYASRINRFGSESEESSFDYYDDYNTGSGCNCGGGSNWSMSFGVGMGMGMGMGYGYPYYGSSFMAGYNMGYYDAMWNNYYGYSPYYGYPPYYGYGGGYGGYYGGGYYGGGSGYYDPVEFYSNNYYGPRGGGSGGSSIPSERGTGNSTRGGETVKKESDPVMISRGGGSTATTGTGATTIATGGTMMGRPANGSSTSTSQDVDSRQANTSTEGKMKRPTTANRTTALGTTTTAAQTPRYQKPKSYESISSDQPRSSQEFVRSSSTKRVTTTNNSNPYTRTRKTNSGSNSSFGSTSRSYNNSSGSGYSSPSRSSSSRSSSYSSPSRSSSGSSSYRSSGSSSGGSRSTSSRSSGSSSGGSRTTSKR